MAGRKFLRTDWHKYSKLGVRRKKKQKYRKSKGMDNKIRLNIKGHLKNIRIGFRSKKKIRGLINGMRPVIIHNLNELKKIKTGEIGVLSKIGNKKKKEIAEYILKNNIQLLNLNSKKFLRKNMEEKNENQRFS